eukprot:TRINITY_DN1683_c0_g1_i1.p1 TRINITY_DN1683_c0_g1~~TRINITY_DN1683_c0_g1_i1.p1  ORF type:complete len:234 (-),score=51.05 TRINITY_DN1683_c0_g1_i1:25-699(-)
MTSGGGVVACTFDGGVVFATDTLLSYGSLAKFSDIQRITKVGPTAALAASGDYADFQQIIELVSDLQRQKQIESQEVLNAAEIHSYLSRVLYNARCRFSPLLNNVVVIGYTDVPFLGVVNDVGTTFVEKDCFATGFANYVALPLLRKFCEENPKRTREQAMTIVEEAIRVNYYRDARSLDKIQMAVVTPNGVEIGQPYAIQTNWDSKGYNYEDTKIIQIAGTCP